MSTAIHVEHSVGSWPFNWAATIYQDGNPVFHTTSVAMTRRGAIRRCLHKFRVGVTEEWLPYSLLTSVELDDDAA